MKVGCLYSVWGFSLCDGLPAFSQSISQKNIKTFPRSLSPVDPQSLNPTQASSPLSKYMDVIGVIEGLYRDYIRRMENKMDTTYRA